MEDWSGKSPTKLPQGAVVDVVEGPGRGEVIVSE